MDIGIIGAGFIGRSLAGHARRHGHSVMISNSRGPQSLRSACAAIGCQAGTAEEAARFGEIVMLAVPYANIHDLPAEALRGKIAVDANNYYPDRDGRHPALDDGTATTSGLVARHLAGCRVVKAFNAIMVNDLEHDGKPEGTPGRRALPLAGDDAAAKAKVAALVSQFGFDVVDCGPLDEGWRFERARPAYCVAFTRIELQAVLARTRRDSFNAEYSWRLPE